MRIHRFIYPFESKRSGVTITDKGVVAQIRGVLRLGVGDLIILADGKGHEALCAIKHITSTSVTVHIQERHENANDPQRHVHLYCAILKRENFELVVQKATEIGVSEMTPIVTARTVKLGLRYDRLEKIIKEAAEQAGRTRVMNLNEAMTFDQVLEGVGATALHILCDINSQTPWDASSKPEVDVCIGPEGGWDPEELEKARERGFHIVTLGPLTLRAETAAIVAAYLACRSS